MHFSMKRMSKVPFKWYAAFKIGAKKYKKYLKGFFFFLDVFDLFSLYLKSLSFVDPSQSRQSLSDLLACNQIKNLHLNQDPHQKRQLVRDKGGPNWEPLRHLTFPILSGLDRKPPCLPVFLSFSFLQIMS